MTPEFKVGIFALGGVALAVTFTVFTQPNLQKRGAYHVEFPRVARLKAGDPVTYNGVKVGQVSDVAPVLAADGTPSVGVSFSVEPLHQPKVLVDGQTTYQIAQGLLGGAELALRSRSGAPITVAALAGAKGSDPVSIDETLMAVRQLIEENRGEVRRAITAIGDGAVSLGQMSTELKDTVHENREQLKATVKNVGDAAGSINAVVVENREAFKATVENFRAMSKGVTTLIEENRDQVKAAIANFSRAGDRVAAAAEDLDKILVENREDFRKTMDGLGKIGVRLDAIGTNLDTITTQIAQGKGTIGKLVMEDTLHTKAEVVLDQASQRLEEVKPFTSGISELRFYAGVGGGYNTRRESGEGSAWLRIEPRPHKFYEAGVTYRSAPADRDVIKDDPDKFNVDFNLQLGWRFFPDDADQHYRLTVAGGLLCSRLGGSVTWHPARNWDVMVSGREKHNTRDPQDRRYEQGDVQWRGTVTWRIWERVGLTAGVDDFEKPGPWFGLSGEILDNDLRNLTTAASFKP